jgi:glyoxylase-like metal-dependent hydrolase (beta-lactamase superfamily II)
VLVRAKPSSVVQQALQAVGAQVFERGWLSSNNVLFRETSGAPSTVVDTGYCTHAELTVALLRRCLGSAPLQRIVNTHLHSDHCGGNAVLQDAWQCQTLVPHGSFDAAARWDEGRLSYRNSGQPCPRFSVSTALMPGQSLRMARHEWEVHAAAGHDPLALMFFEPHSRLLISGDALWQHGLAIVFPELEGAPGFDETARALDTIERLNPTVVIPGHGAPFDQVSAALAQSRQRLDAFARDPRKHNDYAVRALVMFHMLDAKSESWIELSHWVAGTPLMRETPQSVIELTIDRLIAGGALSAVGDMLFIPRK